MSVQLDRWDQLLQCYVNPQGRVNYRAWQSESATALADWLQHIAAENWQSGSEDEQLAIWLNLYNALVIQAVLQRYPIASIQPKVLGVPNWIAFLRFFTQPVFAMSGHRYSLNDIEHRIIRPRFREPRVHFALVCAAIGCPLLRHEAYHPERVRQQLEDDADRFIHNSAKVRYEAGVLYCSKILKWYRKDFLAVSASIPDYLHRYLTDIDVLNAEVPIHYLRYDWNLNTSDEG